jgi:glucosamine--fructose-6-phosphate aminotransferase (isomerizing)
MCGIIGYVGQQSCDRILLEGLERLEYRGYDSAGISLMDPDGGDLSVVRSVGNLSKLREAVGSRTLPNSHTGVGHTRWATHGRPTQANAHPITDCSGNVSIVLNGIIENYVSLREELKSEGHHFSTETDAEVVAHLVERAYDGDLVEAVKVAYRHLEGHFAIVVMSKSHPDLLVGARKQCPLVIGVGDGETYIASAIAAFLKWTKAVQMIEDGEIVIVTPEGARFESMETGAISREITEVDWDDDAAEKQGYETFMLKEIHEQPEALENTLGERLRRGAPIQLDELALTPEILENLDRVVILGCGTSYHAGLVGRYLIESWAGVVVECELASEWRYREVPVTENTLVIGVTQSGETADTLAAMERAARKGAHVVAMTNVLGSQATNIGKGTLFTRAGLEIGVAATKTHTAQVMAFAIIALYLAQERKAIGEAALDQIRDEIHHVPDLLQVMLESQTWHEHIRRIADRFHRKEFFLYLGRHLGLPVCLEGALKLKEISYIPTDAYAAGEMKHGPIALLDEDTPVVVVATDSHVYDKVVSNIQEVRARGAKVIAIASEGNEEIRSHADHVIHIPKVSNEFMPLLAVVPLQILSYHIASMRGLNVDQPRNLAKTVTVE